MYLQIENSIRETLRRHIAEQYGAEVSVVVERPPKLEMGEVASPICFELAKQLKRAPRQIAQEIAGSIGAIQGVARLEVAGGGYLNAFLDRGAFLSSVWRESSRSAAGVTTKSERIAEARSASQEAEWPAEGEKNIVEHTCINPNKAAHIGHLRNAALGDSYVRLLRHAGRNVEIQNYIDNTGVQVADVVLGFMHLEHKSSEEVRALAAQARFDYLCWDLYAQVTQFLEADPAGAALRGKILQAIEEGRGEEARIAEIVSTAIVQRHLRTLDRLGIDYDLLPRESEILHLKFWDAAFEQLKQKGAVRYVTSGKNAGCWVMDVGSGAAPAGVTQGFEEYRGAPANEKQEAAKGERGEEKILVRSNGTVTYVGKDIAYHLWKFGLLGRDFGYRPFHHHPDGHLVWVTSEPPGDAHAPRFGRAQRVYNVIDTRQSYPQQAVAEGLRSLGFAGEANNLTHLAYEVVALTPRCASEMGYTISDEEARRPYVEISGRRGQGVKADDLLDKLESSALAEVDARHPELSAEERGQIGHAIATGALRYFLLKYARSTIIAFDFQEALSFEGETGPYVQYAVVRARNIFRKLHEQQPDFDISVLGQGTEPAGLGKYLAPPEGNGLWELALLAGSLEASIQAAVNAQEPAFVAKYAFQLAQQFNTFYHTHHILSEANAERKSFLLLLTALIERQLTAALGLLGIASPEKM